MSTHIDIIPLLLTQKSLPFLKAMIFDYANSSFN